MKAEKPITKRQARILSIGFTAILLLGIYFIWAMHYEQGWQYCMALEQNIHHCYPVPWWHGGTWFI
jgi:hypothetical protein